MSGELCTDWEGVAYPWGALLLRDFSHGRQEQIWESLAPLRTERPPPVSRYQLKPGTTGLRRPTCRPPEPRSSTRTRVAAGDEGEQMGCRSTAGPPTCRSCRGDVPQHASDTDRSPSACVVHQVQCRRRPVAARGARARATGGASACVRRHTGHRSGHRPPPQAATSAREQLTVSSASSERPAY